LQAVAAREWGIPRTRLPMSTMQWRLPPVFIRAAWC
jgi:hypothetical protein